MVLFELTGMFCQSYELEVVGEGIKQLTFSLEDIKKLPKHTIVATIQVYTISTYNTIVATIQAY